VSSSTNILCVHGHSEGVSITGADRSLTTISTTPPFKEVAARPDLHGSPVLSVITILDNYVLSTSMSGQLILHHAPSGQVIAKCRHHLKYAVQVAATSSDQDCIIATAGWDQKVHVYAFSHSSIRLPNPQGVLTRDEPYVENLLHEPLHTITLTSNPESLFFVRHPDNGDLYLVLSRRDSTFLYYYRFSHVADRYMVHEAGRQNLAPHANAWVGFTPSCLAISPKDPTLLAVATSHLPHLKVIVVRLLFPAPTEQRTSPHAPQTQAAQARAELAVQDKEDTAITLHVTTMAPQTPYSTPQVVWRPDASGLWVNGDDGLVRGLEVKTGKVVALLKAHEVGSKVRTLWAGYAADHDHAREGKGQELLVSGGFDKKVFVWTAAPSP